MNGQQLSAVDNSGWRSVVTAMVWGQDAVDEFILEIEPTPAGIGFREPGALADPMEPAWENWKFSYGTNLEPTWNQ